MANRLAEPSDVQPAKRCRRWSRVEGWCPVETAAGGARSGRRERAAGDRLLVPVRYGLLRLRAHAPRNLIVALGIAVGAAVLALTAVGSAAVQDRAVQRALAQLQPSDRAV